MILLLRRHRWPLLLLFFTFGLYFITLFARLLFYKNGALYIGHEHAWSDWPLHIAIANIFAYQPIELWFEHHPMFAHGGLRYTFLTDFISGMMMRAGTPLVWAFALPSMVFALALTFGIYTLFNLLLKSKRQALLVVTLFYLSSGLGFFIFLGDLIESPSWGAIFYPELMYSRAKEFGWHSGNIISGFLVPQRSSLLGMAIAVWVLVGFIFGRYFATTMTQARVILFVAAIFAGILPLAHMHSFLVVAFITGILSLSSLFSVKDVVFPWCAPRRVFCQCDLSWLIFAIPAALLSCILYWVFFYSGNEMQSYIRFYPFWEAKGSFFVWLWMWFKLWGPVIPMALVGLYYIRTQSAWRQIIYYGFVVIFVWANFFLLQPVPWDNSKLFFWSYLAFVALVVQLLARMWHSRSRRFGRFDVVLICIVLCFTGALEALRLQRIDRNQFQIASKNEMAMAMEVRVKTDPGAVFVTSSYIHQFIMVWAPRPILLGFKGWMANFGFDYRPRDRDISAIYQGKGDVDGLLKKYQVSYVVVDPGAKREYKADEAYFARRFPVAFRDNSVKIYDVRSVGLD